MVRSGGRPVDRLLVQAKLKLGRKCGLPLATQAAWKFSVFIFLLPNNTIPTHSIHVSAFVNPVVDYYNISHI